MRIVVLTGAGISAESGIKTFRAADGLWENHKIEEVATPEAFVANPELVHRFYNLRRKPIAEQQVSPNQAHLALAKLQQASSVELTLVTQNIDDLHERAGSDKVLHMHGEILKIRCTESNQVFDCTADISINNKCDCCDLASTLRPHIVWFGEMPMYMDYIYQKLSECDLFVAIGTSGNVYPAAGFVEMANRAGAQSLELNLEASNVANQFTKAEYGAATEVVPAWVESVLEQAED